jgi:hypothetical protein
VANPDFPRRSNHDLRRVFTSVVNNKDLVLPAKLVKMLINHSTLDDVTDGYVEFEVRARPPYFNRHKARQGSPR